MLNRRVGVVVVVMALVAGACGGGSSLSAEEDAVVEEIVAAMDISPPEGFPPDLFGDTEARCWGEAMVATVGVEGLKSVGFGSGGFSNKVEADEAFDSVIGLLTDETAGEYMAMAMKCVDFSIFVAEEMIADGLSRAGCRCRG